MDSRQDLLTRQIDLTGIPLALLGNSHAPQLEDAIRRAISDARRWVLGDAVQEQR